MNVYLKIISQNIGPVKGPYTKSPMNGGSLILSYRHDIATPQDANTGMVSGRRKHGNFIIVKNIDQTSPLLHLLLTTNDKLPSVVIGFMGLTHGLDKLKYTIQLVNANIVSIQEFKLSPTQENPDNTSCYEEISFLYESIEWTWENGSVTSNDTWN